MDWKKLPLIDWELGKRLAGNNQALAKDIMVLFLKDLPRSVSLIKQLYQDNQMNSLLQQIHRLHGALSYCGFPRLKYLVVKLETMLKKKLIDELPFLVSQLDIEAEDLLKARPLDLYPLSN